MGYSFLINKLVIFIPALPTLQGEEAETQHLLRIYHGPGECPMKTTSLRPQVFL